MIPRAALLDALETTLRDWTEAQYCRGAYARAAGGARVAPTSARAIRWNVIGAVAKVLGVEPAAVLRALGAYIAPASRAALNRAFARNDRSYAQAVDTLRRLRLGVQAE
jgi:hypothetical protein